MPDSVIDDASLLLLSSMAAQYPAGNLRVYANNGIGLFAHLAAAAGGTRYAVAFSQLTTSLKCTSFLRIANCRSAYAWGYDEGKPRRMGGGMLMDEAGGVKASARDVAQWVQLNLQADPTASPVPQAGISRAQQRYAQSAQMYQGWAGKCWITR